MFLKILSNVNKTQTIPALEGKVYSGRWLEDDYRE
jgi:hypothetical protein